MLFLLPCNVPKKHCLKFVFVYQLLKNKSNKKYLEFNEMYIMYVG